MGEETTKPDESPAAAQETKSSEAGLPAEQKAETTIPDTGELKVPLWIKLMWLGFVIWIIWYVVMGLQSSPDSWA